MSKNSIENINLRREQILNYLATHQQVTIGTLLEEFDISEMTLRRDINYLLNANMIIKGINSSISLNHDPAFDAIYYKRYIDHHIEKVQIAKKAIDLVNDGDVIGIDSSTTALELGKLIRQKRDITLITNNLYIPIYLTKCHDLTIFFIGGMVNSSNSSTEGSISCHEISNYNFDIAFISANALDFETGLSNYDYTEIDTKLSYLKNAKKKILLIDSSKFSKKAAKNFLDLHKLDIIVTDSKINGDQIQKIKDMGIDLLIAD